MRKNAGTKLQDLAVIIGCVGAVLSFIGGLALFVMADKSYRMEESYIFAGIMVIAVGTAISFVAARVLDAFGALVDNSFVIVERLGKNDAANECITNVERAEIANDTVSETVNEASPDEEYDEANKKADDKENAVNETTENTGDKEEKKDSSVGWLILLGVLIIFWILIVAFA